MCRHGLELVTDPTTTIPAHKAISVPAPAADGRPMITTPTHRGRLRRGRVVATISTTMAAAGRAPSAPAQAVGSRLMITEAPSSNGGPASESVSFRAFLPASTLRTLLADLPEGPARTPFRSSCQHHAGCGRPRSGKKKEEPASSDRVLSGYPKNGFSGDGLLDSGGRAGLPSGGKATAPSIIAGILNSPKDDGIPLSFQFLPSWILPDLS